MKKASVVPNRVMVSPNQAAALFDIAPGTLGNMRSKKVGPPFFKVGRSVKYRLEDLESYFTQSPVLTTGYLEKAG
jgi:hypothetical protein